MTTERRLAPGVAYQSLAQLLRGSVAEGQFNNGRRLPTEAELSAQYGVSRQTVRRALQELVAEGLVFRVRGRGTFVAPVSGGKYLRSVGSVEDLLALSFDTVMETIRPLERKADIEAASRLRTDSDQVITGLFRRLNEGVPFSVTRVYLPLAVGRRIIDQGALVTPGEVSKTTVIGQVDNTAPQPIAGAHQSITAAEMPAELAPLVDRDTADPALRIDRFYFDAAGRPLELAISYFNPERYSYRLELRRSIPPSRAEPR